MLIKRLAAAALCGLLAMPAFAQAPAPASRPGVIAPTTPSTAPTAAAKPAMAPVNVNTATAKDLDKLPSIGKARAAAIVNERTKGGAFKDWADFDKRMTGTNVNAGVKAKIKDMVTF